jgi:hypothetical protein
MKLPTDYRIRNHYIEGGDTFSSFSAEVVFRKPDNDRVSVYTPGRSVTLRVFESYDGKIGLNSSSVLAVRLSSRHDIFLLLREQGADKARSTTFAKLPIVLQELAEVANLPMGYRIEKQYEKFFRLLFDEPLKDQEVKKLPGIEDCDTFYGYFKTRNGVSYEGISVRISHPIYCGGECTREYERIRNAEYLGTPTSNPDYLFFLIENNAVYLKGEYDKDFGTFSGTNSFVGKIEILNGDGEVLHEGNAKFKGWER